MPDMILKKLSELEQVEAIALGGSRAGRALCACYVPVFDTGRRNEGGAYLCSRKGCGG